MSNRGKTRIKVLRSTCLGDFYHTAKFQVEWTCRSKVMLFASIICLYENLKYLLSCQFCRLLKVKMGKNEQKHKFYIICLDYLK